MAENILILLENICQNFGRSKTWQEDTRAGKWFCEIEEKNVKHGRGGRGGGGGRGKGIVEKTLQHVS